MVGILVSPVLSWEAGAAGEVGPVVHPSRALLTSVHESLEEGTVQERPQGSPDVSGCGTELQETAAESGGDEVVPGLLESRT